MSAPLNILVEPIALPKPAAAAALGMSVDSFERHAQSDLRVIRRGSLRLFPVEDLKRWARDNAELTLSARAA